MLRQIQDTVENSLEYSLINLGQLKAQNKETNVQQLFLNVIKDCREYANLRNAALLFDPENDLPVTGETDEAKLSKILTLLICHAIDNSVSKRVNIHTYSSRTHNSGHFFIDITAFNPRIDRGQCRSSQFILAVIPPP